MMRKRPVGVQEGDRLRARFRYAKVREGEWYTVTNRGGLLWGVPVYIVQVGDRRVVIPRRVFGK
jgi:hypothetical protein